MRWTLTKEVDVRPMRNRDMDEVVGIDFASYEQCYRWDRAQWSDVRKETRNICNVVEDQETERVLGMIVVRPPVKYAFEVVKLAVHPQFRRYGLASMMLAGVESAVTQAGGRRSVTMDVAERELPIQLLLNKRWWRCVLSVGPAHDRVMRFVFRGN